MMTLDDLGKTVRHSRKELGFTQPELAERAGVSRALVAKLETGRLGELGITKLVRILAVLNLDLRVSTANARRPTLEDLQGESNDT